MSWYAITSYAFGGSLLLLTALGIALSFLMPALDRWNKRYLISLFSLQLVCVILCFADAVLYLDPRLVVTETVIINAGFLALAPLPLMPAIFLLHHSGEKLRRTPLFWAIVSLCVGFVIMVVIAQFTDAFYSISSDNVFSRGDFFPLLLSPLALSMTLNIIGVLVRRKKLVKRYLVAFLLYLPPMIVSIILHMFFSIEIFVLLCMGIWALSLMALIISHNVGEFMRQQQEIANQKASIMVLQMRPHFIYNSMMSIYYLCDQDPMKAKQVTLDFTTYLRKNFAAIAREGNIPFVEELEHTRAYLAVEQAQFEDSLFVDFDTPHTLFHLPPLTLQPIVENAVKHGMTKSNAPIHIAVTTRKTDDKSEIIVEDDGPGFKPSDDNEPHIALSNIRARLEMLGGNLEIYERKGGGTSVKVTLPLPNPAE